VTIYRRDGQLTRDRSLVESYCGSTLILSSHVEGVGRQEHWRYAINTVGRHCLVLSSQILTLVSQWPWSLTTIDASPAGQTAPQ